MAFNNTPTMRLHPFFDVVLVAHQNNRAKRFEVSSATLVAQSPFFRALFDPRFAEGAAVQNGSRLEIPLDDNPVAMEMVLCALVNHWPGNDGFAQISPDLLAEVAVLADKYQANQALKFYTRAWFADARQPESYGEIGQLFTAAFFLRSAADFKRVTRTMVREYGFYHCQELQQLPIPGMLPHAVTGAVISAIKEAVDKIYTDIEAAEVRLANGKPRTRWSPASALHMLLLDYGVLSRTGRHEVVLLASLESIVDRILAAGRSLDEHCAGRELCDMCTEMVVIEERSQLVLQETQGLDLAALFS